MSGFVIESGVARCPYGSEKVIDSLKKSLLENNFKFASQVEMLLVRYIMEQVMSITPLCVTHFHKLVSTVLKKSLSQRQWIEFEEKGWGEDEEGESTRENRYVVSVEHCWGICFC